MNWQAITAIGACSTAFFGALTALGTWQRTWIALKEYRWRVKNVHSKPEK